MRYITNLIVYNKAMKLLEELGKLNLPKNLFAIFGSGPLAARNLREANDLDIIVKDDLWNSLIQKYKLTEKGSIKIGEIEIFKDWLPWIENKDDLINSADFIDGYKYVKLEYVLKWKKALNRDKDKIDIELINRYMETSNAS